jgi:hypothetical protein
MRASPGLSLMPAEAPQSQFRPPVPQTVRPPPPRSLRTSERMADWKSSCRGPGLTKTRQSRRTWGADGMTGLLKIIFGTAAGIELASYDMAYQAVRNLAHNRDRLAAQLTEGSLDSSEAADIKYHLQRIDDELARFAYYGIVPPTPARSRPSRVAPSRGFHDRDDRKLGIGIGGGEAFEDRERRILQLIKSGRSKRR